MKTEDYPMLDLFERTPDLVCIVDKPGWFKKANPAVIKTLGYTEEELFAMPVSNLIHPEDKEITSENRNRLLNQQPLLNFQNRYFKKDGTIVWLEWTSVFIPEKEIVFAIAKDITSRKTMEIEIEENYKKYKGLTAHFKHHVEKDRQFFAAELHEELAQLATVIKMNIEWINSQQQQFDEVSKKRIQHVLTSVELLINKIRKLSYSINPGKISEFGLDTVLSSLCQEFFQTTRIPCSYKSSFEEKNLDEEVKTDLLRICQEALANVRHHAQATEIKIRIVERKNKIELSVTDNGKGFEHKTTKRFGLQNMQGRADSINGELSIKSKKSQGTRVSIKVNTKE